MSPGLKAALIMYYAAISITALIVAFYDRNEIKNRRQGVKTRNILILSGIGGALWMYAVFMFTRHRTREKLTMILLPVFIIIHTAIATLLFLKW